MSSTYTIGATHEAMGNEGQQTFVGSEAEAVVEAARIATAAGHGWHPYVLDADGNRVDVERIDA